MKYQLKPYQDCPYKISVTMEVQLPQVKLTFVMEDQADIILSPISKSPAFVEGLWEQTCFEFFYNNKKNPHHYVEWNFSPSYDWCCYEFENYRGIPLKNKTSPPQINQNKKEFQIELKVSEEFNLFNLTCVLKTKDNQTHFFALKHRPEKADFHWQEAWQKIN